MNIEAVAISRRCAVAEAEEKRAMVDRALQSRAGSAKICQAPGETGSQS